MATQVAIDKLMPKPIQITISMQGGGGLRGLGERPVSSVYGRPIPRTIYRQYGGMSDWGISSADMEAAYSTGAFGPELAQESFFDPPDIESQRVHGTSPHDIYRHGEAYGKPPGSQPAASTGLDDYGDDGQPDPEMQKRIEAYRQQGLRGMMQGGFKSPQAYRDYMSNWKSEAEKSRSDAYWAQNPYGNWVTETFGGTKGTSLVLPEQAPISKNDAINNVLEDDTLSSEEKQEQIDYIFMWGPVVNRDMGRLKTASRQRRDDMKARARAQGYSPTQNKNKGGGLSSVKKSININGQPHKLAWIRPDEASALKAMGGSGKKVEGIPAYFDEHSWGESDIFDTTSTGGDPAISDPTYSFASDTIESQDYDIDPSGDYPVPKPDTSRIQSSGGRGADPRTFKTSTGREDYKRPEEYDLGKGLFGFGDDYDFNDVKKVWMTQYIQSGRPRHDPVTQKEIDIEEEWEKAKNAPGGISALAEGFRVGDPMGHQMRESFKQINNQLKNKFKSETDKKSVGQDDEEPYEMTREELSALVEEMDIEGLEDFTPYSGLDYPIWAPGGILAAGMDFLSRTVIGTGTVGGVGVHIHKDGSITPISPEDSPGFDHESMKGENVEPVRRRRRGPPPVAPAATLEPEAPAKGTMAELLARRGPAATRAQGLASLTREGSPLRQVYTEEQIEDFNLAQDK